MSGWTLLMLSGCLGSVPSGPEHTLTVLAASSLTDVFDELERGFEEDHPEVDVVVSTAGSQALATWIRHGISADVFASADARHIMALAEDGLVGPPRPFAENTLVLAVSDGVAAPPDLASLPAVGGLVVGDDEVPVGRYTAQLLDAAEDELGPAWRAAVEARIVSREPNARLVVAKVALGEADAAVVYRTDVAGMDGVRSVPLLARHRPTATYLHAVLAAPPEPRLARAWLEHVASAEGRATLSAHGFVVDGPTP